MKNSQEYAIYFLWLKTKKGIFMTAYETISKPVSKFVKVKNSSMHYLEAGEGKPFLFIHGNPTSSFLWRNIIIRVKAKCIAVDLIGMGESSKPDLDYSFKNHYEYLEEFILKLGFETFSLVIHDWGAALGFYYALNNPEKINSIVFMEPMLFPIPNIEDLKGDVGEFFKNVRNPEIGYEMIINQNFFIEKMLPGMTKKGIDNAKLEVYRKPYIEKDHRKPLLKWPLEVPIAGEPKENEMILNNIIQNLQNGKLSNIPKLLLYVKPGAIMPLELVDMCKNTFGNLQTKFIGEGLHFIQEDLPNEISTEINEWIEKNQEF